MTPENERKREWLCRYLEAERDRLILFDAAERYRLSALPSGISYDGVGGSGSVPHGYEVYAAKLDEYWTELGSLTEKCIQIRREVTAAIESLPSETERLVMKSRYIHLEECRTNGRLTGLRLRHWDVVDKECILSEGYSSQVHGKALMHLNI